jgi:hypothetical protein
VPQTRDGTESPVAIFDEKYASLAWNEMRQAGDFDAASGNLSPHELQSDFRLGRTLQHTLDGECHERGWVPCTGIATDRHPHRGHFTTEDQ